MNRRLALIAAAVVLALVGAIAVYSYAHNADKRALDKTRAANVVIALKQVPAGTSWSDALKGGYFKVEREPADAVPDSAISDLNVSIPVDEVAGGTITPGQILLRPMFSAQTALTGAVPIPKGLMAVTVAVTGDAAVAGYLQPQAQVAVFGTSKIAGGPAQQSAGAANTSIVNDDNTLKVTKLLLPRVTVIATSQKVNTALNANGTTQQGGVLVTLAVNQTQAERIILAEHSGTITMALLSDTSVTGEDDGTLSTCVCNPKPVYAR